MTSQPLTPYLGIDAQPVRRNLQRMAQYTSSHRLALRPHTKTHKSVQLARMQLEHGAAALTVAKVGEARVMTGVSDDILMAFPPADAQRCAQIAQLAQAPKIVRVAVDSVEVVDLVSDAARSAAATVGILVDLDVGNLRTGVQSPGEALNLAQQIARRPGLRLDGILFFPGHLSHGPPGSYDAAMRSIDALLGETIDLWGRHGLEARIVSGGSTPTAFQSHLISHLTEIRPGTYIFNDMNCVRAGCATLDDCAARIVCTVISTAVPGQVVLDAGSKTLTSDRCGPAPESGHGYVLEFPEAKIFKLSEEHAQVDVSACPRKPKLGERVNVIPNHICPCVNLQDRVWWQEPSQPPAPLSVDARGKVF